MEAIKETESAMIVMQRGRPLRGGSSARQRMMILIEAKDQRRARLQIRTGVNSAQWMSNRPEIMQVEVEQQVRLRGINPASTGGQSTIGRGSIVPELRCGPGAVNFF